MKKLKKKLVACLLALGMSLGMMPAGMLGVNAAQQEESTYLAVSDMEPIDIIMHPKDTVVDSSGTASFSVIAYGSNLKYLWQYYYPSSSKWTDWTAKKTAAITCTASGRDGMKVRCVITDGDGNSVTSDEAVLTVGTPQQSDIAITAHPVDCTVEEGGTAFFYVIADANNPTYLWQYCLERSNEWTDWTAKTTPGITCTSSGRENMQVRCKITDGFGNTTISDSARLLIESGESKVLGIVKNPVDVTVQSGETAAFSVIAQGDRLTYLWQYQERNKTTWKDWTTKTTPSITCSSKGHSGMKVRCVVTDKYGESVTSEYALLSVKQDSNFAIVTQPQDCEVSSDDTAAFSVTATGSELTYLWQYRFQSYYDWVDWTTKKTPSITFVSSGLDGMRLRCVITDGDGNVLISDTVTLTVNNPANPVRILKQPEDFNVVGNGNAFFSVIAAGDGLKYLWQYKLKNKTDWVDWTTKTTASISCVPTGRSEMKVRCKITDRYGETVTSDEATLHSSLEILQHPVNYIVNDIENDKPAFSVSAKGDGLTYLWQYRYPNSKKEWVDWTTKKKSSIQCTPSGRNGMEVRCVVSDSTGNSMVSNSARIVYALKILQQPESCEVEYGDYVKFSIGVQGYGLTYYWQAKRENETDWTKLSEESVSAIELNEQQYFGTDMKIRCVVRDILGNRVTSDEADLHVIINQTPLAITKQPENCHVEASGTASFSVEAEGPGLTYLWQYIYPSSSKGWVDWTTKTKPTLTCPAKDRHCMRVRCVVTDRYGHQAVSDEAYIAHITDGTTTTLFGMGWLDLVGTGNKANLIKNNILRWPEDTTDPLTFASLDTSVATVNRDGIVSFKKKGKTSIIITSGREVAEVPVEVDYEMEQQPENATAFIGDRIEFKAKASYHDSNYGGPSYSWWYQDKNTSKPNEWHLCRDYDEGLYSGECTDTLTVYVNSKTANRLYWCEAEYGSWSEDTGYVRCNSNTVKINIQYRFTKNPEDVSGVSGEWVTLSADADPEGLKYYLWGYTEPGDNHSIKCNDETLYRGNGTGNLQILVNETTVNRNYYCTLLNKKTSVWPLAFSTIAHVYMENPE